jgi:hypothetical protein
MDDPGVPTVNVMPTVNAMAGLDPAISPGTVPANMAEPGLAVTHDSQAISQRHGWA